MPEMREIFSSHIAAVGYDPGTQDFHVTWQKGGRTSVYGGVPPEVASQITSSPSIGEALHALVRGKYSHRYL